MPFNKTHTAKAAVSEASCHTLDRIRTHTERNRTPTHINQDGKSSLDNKLLQRQRTLTLERPDVTDVDS